MSRTYRRREAEVVREDDAEKIREGREGTTGGWLECPLAVTTLALHLDDLELHAIRTLKEADPPTIARDHLL